MKQKILKYLIKNNGKSVLNLPACAQIVKVAHQNNHLCLWAMVNEHAALQVRTFEVVGTGHEFGNDTSCHCHTGTVFQGTFGTFHVLEVFS